MTDRFGKTWKPFQASNRPVSIMQWFAHVNVSEPIIGLLDPDEYFTGSISLDGVDNTRRGERVDPSLLQKDLHSSTLVLPKHGVAARYGYSGCRFERGGPDPLDKLCGGEGHCDE